MKRRTYLLNNLVLLAVERTGKRGGWWFKIQRSVGLGMSTPLTPWLRSYWGIDKATASFYLRAYSADPKGDFRAGVVEFMANKRGAK